MYEEGGEMAAKSESRVLSEKYRGEISSLFGGRYDIQKPAGDSYNTVTFSPNFNADLGDDVLKTRLEQVLQTRLKLRQAELQEAKKNGTAPEAENSVWHAEMAIRQIRGEQKGTNHLDDAVAEMSLMQEEMNAEDYKTNQMILVERYHTIANEPHEVKISQLNKDRQNNSYYLRAAHVNEALAAAGKNLKSLTGRALSLVKAV